MNKKSLSKIVTVAIAVTTILSTTGKANAEESTPPSNIVEIEGLVVDTNDPAWDEYQWQMANGGAPIRFWQKVAKCETGRDWKDHGRFSGGLGIMNSSRFGKRKQGTWERWGGEQFGLTPQEATPLQQIVVANRIAVFGWKATYRGWNGKYEKVIQANYYKKPSGFNGWGCIKIYRSKAYKKSKRIDPAKWERSRHSYWKNQTPPYKTHEIVLSFDSVPRWAYVKYAKQPNRLK